MPTRHPCPTPNTLLHPPLQGVCRILALYWDLIPSSAATPLLLLLTRDLAHDAAANAVRAAVPAGLKYLLQNGSASSCVGALRGSAAVRSPLSHVAPLVHDTSQRVRTAALDLAIEVAKVRGVEDSPPLGAVRRGNKLTRREEEQSRLFGGEGELLRSACGCWRLPRPPHHPAPPHAPHKHPLIRIHSFRVPMPSSN